jgi:hypothetical protein
MRPRMKKIGIESLASEEGRMRSENEKIDPRTMRQPKTTSRSGKSVMTMMNDKTFFQVGQGWVLRRTNGGNRESTSSASFVNMAQLSLEVSGALEISRVELFFTSDFLTHKKRGDILLGLHSHQYGRFHPMNSASRSWIAEISKHNQSSHNKQQGVASVYFFFYRQYTNTKQNQI